ncbi:hypothetical protein SAMN05443245_3397 [Paraburkholderia fungorum]|uniref:Uncharacterized protein n=1 Tax=Paraburkholderia fungorum TaxID=134537 RepID=A0A1H1GZ79_9BURK|nr:hypothetical protein [Paraburkholderia fungorum]SDR18494.1 hypothetical protein SAMN05443245_3397 [Paraburkholderia fungorum]
MNDQMRREKVEAAYKNWLEQNHFEASQDKAAYFAAVMTEHGTQKFWNLSETAVVEILRGSHWF